MNLTSAKAHLDAIYAQYEGLRGFGDTTGKVYEEIIQSLYTMLLHPGDASMDLGACYGMHTFPMARCVGAEGRVIAFEPLPGCREKIQAQAKRENLAERIQLSPVALARADGTATFFAVEGNIIGHSGLREKPNYPDGVKARPITVDTRRLDSFAPADKRVRFIKADLEGGEFDAMVGGEQLLREHRPVLAIESALAWDAKQFGYKPEDFFAFFAGLDYGHKDILGCPFTPLAPGRPYPHYLVCYPREMAAEVGDLLTLAVMKHTFGPRWFGLSP